MQKLFDMDNRFMKTLGKAGDLILLNLLFLVTCIPFFTIGAALTALYDVTLRMAKNEEAYIARSFFSSFKLHLKKSTVLWLAVSAAGGLLFLDLRIINAQNSALWYLIRSVLFSVLLIWWIVVTYIFPLIAKYDWSCRLTLKNALLIAMKHVPCTAGIVTINSLLAVALFTEVGILFYFVHIYLVIGFAFAAHINSILLVKVFDKYEEKRPDYKKEV